MVVASGSESHLEPLATIKNTTTASAAKVILVVVAVVAVVVGVVGVVVVVVLVVVGVEGEGRLTSQHQRLSPGTCAGRPMRR